MKYLTFEETTREPYNDNICLLRHLPLPMHGNERLKEEIFKLINLFLKKTGGIDPASFRGAGMQDIAAGENFVQAVSFMYDIDIIDRRMIGELAKRIIGLYSNTVRLLRYNSHICYVSNINALFTAFCCPSFDQLFNETGNLE